VVRLGDGRAQLHSLEPSDRLVDSVHVGERAGRHDDALEDDRGRRSPRVDLVT
jgi:hypothetical protein